VYLSVATRLGLAHSSRRRSFAAVALMVPLRFRETFFKIVSCTCCRVHETSNDDSCFVASRRLIRCPHAEFWNVGLVYYIWTRVLQGPGVVGILNTAQGVGSWTPDSTCMYVEDHMG
jgi:hypothetical protein